MRDAERNHMIELFDRRFERALRGKRADVKLVEDCGRKWPGLPMAVRPRKSAVIDRA
jgi:hypothetical protein